MYANANLRKRHHVQFRLRTPWIWVYKSASVLDVLERVPKVEIAMIVAISMTQYRSISKRRPIGHIYVVFFTTFMLAKKPA